MNDSEIHALRKMLREIADLGEHASLTGAFDGGEKSVVRRYNAVLNQLVQGGVVPEGLFEPISADTSNFGEIAVDARLLSSYLKKAPSDEDMDQDEDRKNKRRGDPNILIRLAPFIKPEDLAALVRDQMSEGLRIDTSTITSLAPFLGSDFLGDLVRKHILTREPREAPEPPPTPPTPGPRAEPVPVVRDLAVAEPAEPPRESETLETLADRLRRPDLTPQEREEIALRLAQIAHEQASSAHEAKALE